MIPSAQMKISAPVFTLALVAMSISGPLHAQLVHLSFVAEQFTGSVSIRGDRHLFYPWDTAGRGPLDEPLYFDLYYDPNAPQTGSEDWGAANYGRLDPNRNSFRMRYQGYGMEKPLDVSRPITGFAVFERQMSFMETLDANWPYPNFEFNMHFQDHPSVDFAVPQPPFPAFEPLRLPHLFLESGRSLFDLEGLAEASFSVRFTAMEYEIISDFKPIPEPSTYGLGAALLLGGAWGLRRWKTQNSVRRPSPTLLPE